MRYEGRVTGDAGGSGNINGTTTWSASGLQCSAGCVGELNLD